MSSQPRRKGQPGPFFTGGKDDRNDTDEPKRDGQYKTHKRAATLHADDDPTRCVALRHDGRWRGRERTGQPVRLAGMEDAMNAIQRPPKPAKVSPEAEKLAAYDVRDFMKESDQVRLLLDGQTYFLRITRAGKLILTK